MSIVHTGRLSEKLEKIIDFRIGEGASDKHLIVLEGNSSCPRTDGTQIFLPRRESSFASEKDNELLIADSTAHEADHIREINEYFGAEIEQLREGETNLVQEFHQRNYSELKENPALAGWIDKIVKDRRIDAQRREQLPGVKRHHEEVFHPAAEYFRPSVKGMSELDVFREQYLQKSLIGRVIEPIPDKHKILLEEVVALTSTADSIQRDKEVVSRIYQKFKENFDITQPISRLPPMFGTGNHSQPNTGSPQQGYGKEVKPREGREDGKKPEKLDGGKEKLSKLGENGEDKTKNNQDKNKEDEGAGRNDDDRTSLYQQAQKEYGVRIQVVEPRFTGEMAQKEDSFRNMYTGEIESMKRIFRQLQLKHYGDKEDFQGQELNYEDYLQSELESIVTRIKGNGKCFRRGTQNEQRPAWAVLADITPSTNSYKILEDIRAGLFINAEALGVTDWSIGLFGFSSNVLYVINDFPERYDSTSSNKIMALKKEDDGGTYLGPPLRAVGSLLGRQREHPKGITIITDGEDQNFDDAKAAMREVYDQKMYPFLVVIGREFEKYARSLTEEIGSDHYTVIDRDKVYELPSEMFRLFKTFGISR
ncbi:hypothetical protein HYT23_02260 [Candidatus Pacearchaeota archaeon]|nr:hypothetical protein [Candidatus Pacearchaeota archaeon]